MARPLRGGGGRPGHWGKKTLFEAIKKSLKNAATKLEGGGGLVAGELKREFFRFRLSKKAGCTMYILDILFIFIVILKLSPFNFGD